MATTILAIGDPHFKISNIRDTDRMVEAIINLANTRVPDIIVVLGDILDQHESIHVSPLSRSIEFLSQLTKIARTYVLIGNHDLKNNRQYLSTEHPFVSLKYWGEKITIVDTAVKASLNDHEFIFVPYVPPGRFEEALNTISDWKRVSCIFAHQEFKGAQMGAIASTIGDEWSLTYPYVVSGHIHNYQQLQKNIVYIGTPIQHSYGDSYDKTVSYLTFCSGEIVHERVSLKLPRKYIVHLTCSEISNYNIEVNAELKIIISGISGDIKAIMKHPNILRWKQAGHKISYKDTPLTSQHTISRERVKFSILLYRSISNDNQLEDIYKSIFGTPI